MCAISARQRICGLVFQAHRLFVSPLGLIVIKKKDMQSAAGEEEGVEAVRRVSAVEQIPHK